MGKGEKIEGPEADIVQLAKQLYAAGLYSVAQDSFESLRETYPLSPYAELAEIKLADAEYEGRKYDVAALRYEEFVKNHPASPSSPYVLLRAGRSHQLSFGGLGRDIAPLEKAIAVYDRLLKSYPDSNYALTAVAHREEAIQLIAEYERSVGRFYEKQGFEDAARARYAFTEQQIDPQVEAAKKRAARMLAEYEQARTALLEAPQSSLTELPVAPSLATQTAEVVAAVSQAVEIPPGSTFIERVDCRSDSKKRILLYLNRRIEDRPFLDRLTEVVAEDGSTVELQVPNTVSREIKMSCFSDDDLAITKDGTVRLEGAQSLTGFALSTPPRLVLVVE